ncbi:MAG: sigma 54-interacting transcriptional regulator [Sandaracinaceae bacterium]
MSEKTLQQAARGVAIRRLRVEVVTGADASAHAEADSDALSVGTAATNTLTLSDPTVSRYHAELTRESDGVRVRDLGSTNGTFAGAVRVIDGVVPAGATLRLGGTTLRVLDAGEEEQPLLHGEAIAGLRGQSTVMRSLMAKIAKVAESSANVLLTGESGTGKEVAARALHELGPRQGAPFVTVDCGALAPTLVASELFGHERGAFTGAEQRRAGAFEQAHGGTLFLDEVGELPQALQSALLGALERKRFKRLGGTSEISVDVRVVSATHRDLREDVNAEKFRLDLFYRLAVVTLRMPALREHVDDLEILIAHFLEEAGASESVDALLGPAALATLKSHRWPGNVRELRNWVEAALATGEAPTLDARGMRDAGADLIGSVLEERYQDARATVVNELERRYLTRLLERADGNVSQAARIAEMNRSHLNDLLRRHGLR